MTCALHRVAAAALFCLVAGATAEAATVPAGFVDELVASGFTSPTAMAFLPDGRLLVCDQPGALRVIKGGALLAQPFVQLTVDSSGERGLLGVAVDPAFPTSPYVYLYYTATTPTVHNRISRFTAAGDVAAAGSEQVLLDLDDLSDPHHNGGALHFGADGKLYAGVGENTVGSNSQTLANLLGKLLRLNSDGSIPADNPFYGTATGRNRAIWALGLRNPFTFAFQRGTGRLFIDDVGASAWEEINDGAAGANYGWPNAEGAALCSTYTCPLYTYDHSSGACAIIGGAFYNPATAQFPSAYTGKYFFGDLCAGWIRAFDPAAGTAADFASGAGSLTGIELGLDGSLYYLASGAVRRIRYTGAPPPPPPPPPPPGNLIPDPGFEAGVAGGWFAATQYGDSLTRTTTSPITGVGSALLSLGPGNVAGFVAYLPADTHAASVTAALDVRPQSVPAGASARLCAAAYQGSAYFDQCTPLPTAVGVVSHVSVTLPLDANPATGRVNLYLVGGSGGSRSTYTLDSTSLTLGSGGAAQAPQITTQPQSLTVAVGAPATFSVVASGTAPLTYQWQRGGVDIAGATASSYTLASAQASDSGAQLRVVVSNGTGSVTSNVATLTVTSSGGGGTTSGNLIADGGFEAGTAGFFAATQYGDSITRTTTSPITGAASALLSISGGNVAGYLAYLSGANRRSSSVTVQIDVRPQSVPTGASLRLCAAAYQTSGYREQCTAIPSTVGQVTHATATLPLDAASGTDRVNLYLSAGGSGRATYVLDNASLVLTLAP